MCPVPSDVRTAAASQAHARQWPPPPLPASPQEAALTFVRRAWDFLFQDTLDREAVVRALAGLAGGVRAHAPLRLVCPHRREPCTSRTLG